MVKEKNLDAGKQTDKPQEKFSNELMNDEELDQVAGGHCKLFNSDQVADSIAKMLNISESESGVGGWKGFVTKENHCK